MTATHERRTRPHGSVWFLAGSVTVHMGNYAFNVLTARWLTPAQYAEVALAATGLLLIGFITVGFQMATARSVAAESSGPEAQASLARWFSRIAFASGGAAAAVLLAGYPALMRSLNLASPVTLLGIATALPFAFVAGVGRGFAQGSSSFGRLAMSFQVEMLVRLVLGVGAVALGFGVAGAVGGLTASVIAAAVIARPPSGPMIALDPGRRRSLVAALGPALMVLAGEALINHVDTVVAKVAFDPTTAGQFAGVALLGRTVFFVSWPVTMVLFPRVAEDAAAGRSVDRAMWLSVSAVSAVGVVATVVGWVMSEEIIGLALGSDFVVMSDLLGPYLVATALFAVASTMLTLQLAAGDDRAGWLAIAGGVCVVVALTVFHDTPETVVLVQVVLMAVFVAAVAARIRRSCRTPR